MPRPAKTRNDRANDVGAAAAAIGALIGRAIAAEQQHGPTAPETFRAWEAVEVNGATIHRQARILAGKSRGG